MRAVQFLRLFSHKKVRCLVFAAAVSLFLAGCGREVLYTNLSESEANEMLALLMTREISAEKVPGKENTFSVAVSREDFAPAVDLLKWYGLPKEKFTGVGKMFAKTGIVSSPSEERVRFMYALSEDISETLSKIDGVITARVNLVLPQNNAMTDSTTPSSASVFLKFRPGMVPPDLIPQIKTLVANSVEGLSIDRVSVAMLQSTSPEFFNPLRVNTRQVSVLGIQVAPESARFVWLLIAAGGVLLAIIAAGAIAFIVYRRRKILHSATPGEATGG